MTYGEAANLAVNQTWCARSTPSVIALLPVGGDPVRRRRAARRRHAEGPRAGAVRRHRRRRLLLDLHRHPAAGRPARSASRTMQALAQAGAARQAPGRPGGSPVPAGAAAAASRAGGRASRPRRGLAAERRGRAGRAARAGRRARRRRRLASGQPRAARPKRRVAGQPQAAERPAAPRRVAGPGEHAAPVTRRGAARDRDAGSATSRTTPARASCSRTSRRCSPTAEAFAAVVDATRRPVPRRHRSTRSSASRRGGSSSAAAGRLRLGIGFVPVRKAGKLPRRRIAASYALEYGDGDHRGAPGRVPPRRAGPGRRRRAGHRRHRSRPRVDLVERRGAERRRRRRPARARLPARPGAARRPGPARACSPSELRPDRVRRKRCIRARTAVHPDRPAVTTGRVGSVVEGRYRMTPESVRAGQRCRARRSRGTEPAAAGTRLTVRRRGCPPTRRRPSAEPRRACPERAPVPSAHRRRRAGSGPGSPGSASSAAPPSTRCSSRCSGPSAAPTPRPTCAMIERAYDGGRGRTTAASSARAATRTSPTRSRWPRSWPSWA